jgi:N-methylhydantoinase A/oxoprolinase/acetone carboxylase beta subunit
MSESNSKCRVAIDIGGTFTDLVLYREGEGLALTKVPSTLRLLPVSSMPSRPLDSHGDEPLRPRHHGAAQRLPRAQGRTAPHHRGFGDVYAMGAGRDRMYDLHYRNRASRSRRLVYGSTSG